MAYQPITICEGLKKARALCSDPKKWSKGALFRSNTIQDNRIDVKEIELPNDDVFIEPESTEPDTMCMLGLCYKAGMTMHQARVLVKYLPDRYRIAQSIVLFNDAEERTHEEVLAVFDKAIEEECL